ncbi:MAG: CheR family methyltransferase [Coriobacteriia bacterium]
MSDSVESNLSKDLTPEEFARFRDYIHQHSGIYLEDQKLDSLRISLITRATRFSLPSLAEYHDLLANDENEFKELMNLVTINETSFFRFPQQFEAMRTTVIPQILESKPSISRNFRVWSAGCSTGEEPYTIAMTLLDSGIEGLGYRMEVLGTDVSTNALNRAQEGVYPARALLSIPNSVSSRFFEPTARGHRVVDQVRKLITFQYQNLIKEPYPAALMGNWDIIFCRNVTIYFKLESTRRVVDNFYRSINPGGYLFIGHSETLTSISDKFEPMEIGGVFLYRKPVERHVFNFDTIQTDRAPKKRRTTIERIADLRPRERAARREVAPAIVQAAATDASAEDIAPLLEEARTASQEGRNETVLELVSRIQALDPNNAQAFLLSAHVLADEGKFAPALEQCHKALAVDPLLAAVRFVLGMIYLRQGDSALAMSEFKRTVYIDPGFALAYLNMANLHRARGSNDDALREYENTLRTMHDNPEGPWTAFMGGFRPDLLSKTVERSLIECRKSAN